MGRKSWVLCASIVIVNLLPLYFILNGTYSFVRNDSPGNDQASFPKRGGPDGNSALDEEHFKRGVHVAFDGELGIGDSKQSPHSYSRALDSDGVGKELARILSQDESSNSRAAFDKVVALSALLPKITDISRMKTPSPEAFRSYIAPVGLPVIFTNMLEGEMLGEWTWNYVRLKWGDKVFHNTRQGEYSIKKTKLGKHVVNRVSVRLSDFIDIVTGKRVPSDSEKGMYITKQQVIPVEALEAEFYYPNFYPGYHKKCYLEPTGW